ncbi:hypothetical protein HC931_15335 [Candidatus Gracilibacteria bacterium]|nr:hypothetical protein [Candidatus Gracilibacteria bacterium]
MVAALLGRFVPALAVAEGFGRGVVAIFFVFDEEIGDGLSICLNRVVFFSISVSFLTEASKDNGSNLSRLSTFSAIVFSESISSLG